MSYSTFEHVLLSRELVDVDMAAIRQYADVATRRHNFRRDSRLAASIHTISVAVTNSGSRPGAHSILGFAVPPNAGVDGAPLQALIGFEKVWLEVGRTERATLTVTAHDVTQTKLGGGREAVAGLWRFLVGDTQCTIRVS